jgi:hypothetical protein
MIYFSSTISVHAPLEIVWELLTDKVENPQRYVSGVQGLEILEKYPDGVLRKLTHPVPIKERITIDQENLEIIFRLVDPTLFSGYFFNRVHPPTSASELLKLEYGLEIEPLNPDLPFDEAKLPKTFFDTLVHTKELAEAKAAEL